MAGWVDDGEMPGRWMANERMGREVDRWRGGEVGGCCVDTWVEEGRVYQWTGE